MRPLVVSDPKKLTFFAQANLVRAGLSHTAGALGDAMPSRPAVNDVAAGAGQTIGVFLKSLLGNLLGANRTETSSPSSSSSTSSETSSDTKDDTSAKKDNDAKKDDTIAGLPKSVVIVGGIALAGGLGYLIFRKKKRR
jgi:LPXTG-motif cell wall-anchored protein